jgi:hypothetical protein
MDCLDPVMPASCERHRRLFDCAPRFAVSGPRMMQSDKAEFRMRIFVPVEDASLDLEGGVLVPYRYGLNCVRALRAQTAANDCAAERTAPVSDEPAARRPSSGPACVPGRR